MKLLQLIVLGLILTACAGHNVNKYAEKDQALRDYITANPLKVIDKVNSFKFYGWNSLSNDFIILSSSPKRRFLVELSGFCRDIPWAQAIIVNRGQNNILHARFDSISAIDSPEMKCMIKHIYPITKEQFTEIQQLDKPADN